VARRGARNGSIIEPIRLMPFDAVFFLPETASLWWSILALFLRFVLQAL